MARWFWALLCFALLSQALSARAESYEWQRTEKLLAREKLELDPAPEGKTIAWVRIVREEVFVDDDHFLIPILLPKPNPLWPNWLHATTREEVIQRELLFEAQTPLRDARLEESMRNLRGMGVFALVRIVAVRTSDPNQVGVIVHTRDIWSLRLEQDFNITTQINSLLLRITERNLFGRQKNIGGDFLLSPKTYSLREFYYSRRVLGTPLSLSQSTSVVFNRERGEPEGSIWSGSLGRPYFNLKQRYSYLFLGGYSTLVGRRVLNGDVDTFLDPDGGPLFARRAWREQVRAASASASFRRGQSFKQTFGGSFSYRDSKAFAIAETALPEGLREEFERSVLPRQRREIGPGVAYDIFIPKFAVFENLGSFGQSENVQLGPYLETGVRAPLKAFGSSTNSWVLRSAFGVVFAPGGGLIELGASASTRYEQSKLVDQLTTGLVRGATPVFAAMRLVSRTSVELLRNDTSQSLVALGANNGLRGYPSQSIYGYGESRLLQNVELRTLPIAWQAVHVGGVVFADVGSVFPRWREMELFYAVGVGLRVFFPQFNRYPFTFDGGVGLGPPTRFTPTLTAGQVVPLTATEDALLE